MYTLKNIKETVDDYPVSSVNCIEKPISIVLNSYNDRYKSLFLMYLKMIESYRFDDYKDVKESRCSKTIIKVLENEFGIELKSESPSNICEFIESNIDRNNPIMLFGNYRELYYSQYYKKEDWPHLFIINGYNREKELYYILDYTQRFDIEENNYYDFVLPYRIMNDMYDSFEKNLYKNGILYFDSSNVNSKLDTKDILIKCLEKFLSNMKRQPYFELEIVNDFLASSNENVNLDSILENYNYKKVFYKEFSENLLYYRDNFNDLYNEFLSTKEELLNIWKKVSNKVIYYAYKNKKEKILDEMNKALIYEERMTLVLAKILNKLKGLSEEKQDININEYYFENNNDNIIRISNDNEFIFNFNNNKIYNSWSSDNSPKVTFNKVGSEINFMVRVNLLKYSDTSKFLAGLFIRLKDNSLYFWGAKCGLSILLDNSGISPKIFEFLECSDEVLLGIKVNEEMCILEYSLNDDTKIQSIAFVDIKLSDIDQYGFGCKTWGEPEEIKVSIKSV